MPGLSAEAVLAIWERSPVDDAVRGPLTILAQAYPELSEDDLLEMSVGERDSRLLQLREQLFGETLEGFADCPRCAERLEFSIAAGDIRDVARSGIPEQSLDIRTGDLDARLRPPNSHDLLDVQRCADPDQAARLMFERCVEQLTYRGRPLLPGDAPDEVLTVVGEQLSRQQGLADFDLEIQCSICGHRWEAPLDIASFFGRELNRLAGQLLDQVHTLATAYGWSEKAILGMHPQRRWAYLDRLLT